MDTKQTQLKGLQAWIKALPWESFYPILLASVFLLGMFESFYMSLKFNDASTVTWLHEKMDELLAALIAVVVVNVQKSGTGNNKP